MIHSNHAQPRAQAVSDRTRRGAWRRGGMLTGEVVKMRRCLAVILVMVICGVSIAAGAETAEGHVLTRLSFTRWGEMMPQVREVVWEAGGCTIRENEWEPRPLAADLAEELRQVVSDYELESWEGEYSTGYEVLDGEYFSLELEFADGVTVLSTGDNAFPETYTEATEAMDDIFQRDKEASLVGTYVYEGEGFGGDFTITLNADGTYTFYEGPLSSYKGMGTWNTAYDGVYMDEDESGFELHFTFRVEEDALVYLAWGSDAFPCVELPDGGRFVRLDEEEDGMKLSIGETEVPVTWEDNESTAALEERLPLTIEMSMYGGFEQVGPIGQSIPREDSQITTEPGDIVLYSGNQIVLFYGSNAWAYTRLGHVDLSPQEMEDLLGQGDVTITIR